MQGSSRVIACLQDKRDELSFECKATLFDQEVKMAEDIDFKYPMKKNCGAEIDKFCPTVQHGNGRIIRWGAGPASSLAAETGLTQHPLLTQ